MPLSLGSQGPPLVLSVHGKRSAFPRSLTGLGSTHSLNMETLRVCDVTSTAPDPRDGAVGERDTGPVFWTVPQSSDGGLTVSRQLDPEGLLITCTHVESGQPSY